MNSFCSSINPVWLQNVLPVGILDAIIINDFWPAQRFRTAVLSPAHISSLGLNCPPTHNA